MRARSWGFMHSKVEPVGEGSSGRSSQSLAVTRLTRLVTARQRAERETARRIEPGRPNAIDEADRWFYHFRLCNDVRTSVALSFQVIMEREVSGAYDSGLPPLVWERSVWGRLAFLAHDELDAVG